MGSIHVDERNRMLNAWSGTASYTANPSVWVKLHLGDPGTAGTANPAAGTARKQVTFAGTASAGALTNSAAIEWNPVAATETYTHISLWNNSAAGTVLGTDDLSSSAPVTTGDLFRIPVGELDITLT